MVRLRRGYARAVPSPAPSRADQHELAVGMQRYFPYVWTSSRNITGPTRDGARREKVLLGACKRPDFGIADLKRAFAQADEARCSLPRRALWWSRQPEHFVEPGASRRRHREGAAAVADARD